MTARELAIRDIQEDLRSQGKCFLAFHKELNPVMRKLVKDYTHAQGAPVMMRNKTQLVAHCFFCKATRQVTFNNYAKYYDSFIKY